MRFSWFAATFALGVSLVPATAQETIKIGVAAALTGSLARAGLPMLAGAKKAVETINANGGVLGRKIELRSYDDQSDFRKAVENAQHAIEEKVDFIIGPATALASAAATPLYAAAGVLQIEPREAPMRGNALNQQSGLRICGDSAQRGIVLGDYLRNQLKASTVAIVRDGEPSSELLANQIRAALESAKLTIAGSPVVLKSIDDLNDRLQTTQVNGAGAVVLNFLNFGGFDAAAAQSRLPKGRLVIDWVSPGPINFGNQNFQDGRRPFVLQEIDHSVGITVPAELQQIRQEGAIPINSALLAYSAVQVIAEGIRRANTLEPRRVGEVLRQGPHVETLLGDMKFEVDGNANFPRYAVYGLGIGNIRPGTTEVACDNGCRCKDGGCSRQCCKK